MPNLFNVLAALQRLNEIRQVGVEDNHLADGVQGEGAEVQIHQVDSQVGDTKVRRKLFMVFGPRRPGRGHEAE